ncbi:MAG TPA: copper ion binding protein, partial [Planococcus sp. (in: firmicutes)]|nr:copper ion binding protein [Planococcus sp. (in: firmicutes)]
MRWNNMEKLLTIEGMTCASCAQSVEKSAGKLTGVDEASVNLATEKLKVRFDEGTVSIEEIFAAVEQAGYKALAPAETKTFAIEGMTCASCVQSVEKATRKLAGVAESNVNMATEKMVIRFDPQQVSVNDIKAAVADAGYGAVEQVDGESSADLDRAKKEQHIQSVWRRFWLSGVLTIPLLLISMGHMIGMPLPAVVDPMLNPVNFV